jgi:hypothetical protein
MMRPPDPIPGKSPEWSRFNPVNTKRAPVPGWGFREYGSVTGDAAPSVFTDGGIPMSNGAGPLPVDRAAPALRRA